MGVVTLTGLRETKPAPPPLTEDVLVMIQFPDRAESKDSTFAITLGELKAWLK